MAVAVLFLVVACAMIGGMISGGIVLLAFALGGQFYNKLGSTGKEPDDAGGRRRILAGIVGMLAGLVVFFYLYICYQTHPDP